MPTILTAKKGVSLAKTFTPDGVESYGSAKYFEHTPLEVTDIISLSTALTKLEGIKNSCIIRGSFNSSANLPEFTEGRFIQRKKALFTDTPIHWIMLDVDNYPSTLPPEEAINTFIAEELPSGFHSRTYHYQLSSSYGTKGNEGLLKAHLWFWLATPYDSITLREWAKTLPILDYSVFNTVHIHYTASPIFDGLPDPVTTRSGLVEGLLDEVKLVISPVVRTLPDFVPEYVIDTEWPLHRITQEILPNISPDITNDEWVKVGMCLHHQGSGGSEWLQAFDEWSSKGQTYEEDVCSIRWESFYRDSGTKVGIGTLLFMAGQSRSSVATDDEFEHLEVDPAENTPNKFSILPAEEFMMSEPSRYIVKGILPEGDLAILFGPSGSGKSFITLDMAMAIARGIPWRGHKTVQGNVVYLAAEGAGGFRKRLRAYKQHFGCTLDKLYVIAKAPNFLQLNDALAITRLVTPYNPTIVIVDTLAQVTAGANENSGEDMGKALSHCKRIHEATGALVLFVHHTGKDTTKGLRGWSGLFGASEAILEVSSDGTRRDLRVVKQKDGEEGEVFGFKLLPVPIGFDIDGEIETSCICEESNETSVASGVKVSEYGKALLKVVGDLRGLDGIWADINSVKDEVCAQNSTLRRNNLPRIVKKLIDDGLLLEADGRYQLAKSNELVGNSNDS